MSYLQELLEQATALLLVTVAGLLCIFLAQIIGSFEGWATIFVGLIATVVSVYWYRRQETNRILELEGSLSVVVSPDKIITLQNLGALPIELTEVCVGFSELSRKGISESALLDKYRDACNKARIAEIPSGTTLATQDKISVLAGTDIDEPISEKDLVVIAIVIKYRNPEGATFRVKRIGVYWLTSIAIYRAWTKTIDFEREKYILGNNPKGYYEDNWHVFRIESEKSS